MLHKYYSLGALLLLLPSLLFASISYQSTHHKNIRYPHVTTTKKAAQSSIVNQYHRYIGFTGGADVSRMNQYNPMMTYNAGTLTDAYPLNNRQATSGFIGLNAGYEFYLNRTLLPRIALGIGVYGAPGSYKYTGKLVETPADDESLALYNYKFHVAGFRTMLEAQLTWSIERFLPFIQAGIGSAWNRLYAYAESPINTMNYVVLSPFQSQMNQSFAYQLGAGVGYEFNLKKTSSRIKSERVLLGYRYVNEGEVSFGTRGQSYPYKLNFGNLTANEWYLSYVHSF